MDGQTATVTEVRERPGETPDFELIELLFFAYRDFVGDPDRILAASGFGRAHHRVLHFVSRHPGLTIAALLDVLKITKQSLSRVLRDLIEQGYVEQRTGTADRRQRHLHATDRGRDLAARLSRVQNERIARALEGCGPQGRAIAARFLMGMIDPSDRSDVSRLIAEGARGG